MTMLTVDEVLAERREKASRTAVVVETPEAAETMRRVVTEGTRVLVVGCATMGLRFEHIVVACAPWRNGDPNEAARALSWIEDLALCIKPGGGIAFLNGR